jgi:hypothetical protein
MPPRIASARRSLVATAIALGLLGGSSAHAQRHPNPALQGQISVPATIPLTRSGAANEAPPITDPKALEPEYRKLFDGRLRKPR